MHQANGIYMEVRHVFGMSDPKTRKYVEKPELKNFVKSRFVLIKIIESKSQNIMSWEY